MKKILVASFPRSGTHFLINTLSSNCQGVHNGWIDVINSERSKWVSNITEDNFRAKIREQLVDVYYPSRINKPLKTHHQMYVFEEYLSELLDFYDIFYMVRDPRDTLVACFHFYNRTDFEPFIKDPRIASFIRHPLWGVRSEVRPFSFSYVKPANIVDKWQKHVLSWLLYKDRGVHFVHYSDLQCRLKETLKGIASASSQLLLDIITPIGLEDQRFRPDFVDPTFKRGRVGIWRDYLSAADVQFISDALLPDVRRIAWFDD